MADTISISSVDNSNFLTDEIPGYISEAYEFSVGGQFDTATLYFPFDSQLLEDPTFNPVLYYFNEDTQLLEELQTTIVGNVAIAEVSHFSQYIMLNKTQYDLSFADNYASDDVTDSNNDGISNYDTKLICEGKLTDGIGKNPFKGITYAQIQANDDYDNDGLKNGEEVKIALSATGRRYLIIKSSPDKKDTDEDGLTDNNDTQPLVWNVCDRDLAIFAALAYEDGKNFVNKMYKASDIVGEKDSTDKYNVGESYYFLDYASTDEVSGKWKIVDYVNEKAFKDTYFSATTYKNGNNIVIAYRGTNEKIGEWVWNIAGVGLANFHIEEPYAQKYARKIADKYPKCKIYITGHSLGGYLAQYGAAEIIDERPEVNLVQVSYFNGIGLDFNKLTLFKVKNVRKILRSYYDGNKEKGNLISYYIYGDVVSGIGIHSGFTHGFYAAVDAQKHHMGEFGTSKYTDVIIPLEVFAAISKVNTLKYYLHYGAQSLMEYFWITHETDSFLYYLSQGTRTCS